MRRQIVIMLLGLMTTLSLPAFAIAGSRESSHATQPYKYIGKELDRTHGLDWYDHGARHYDPRHGEVEHHGPDVREVLRHVTILCGYRY